MKKLIFIDNDDEQRAKEDIKNFVTPFLIAYADIDAEQAENIQIISDFYEKDRDEMYNLFYSGEYVIITWSVYTGGHHNSKGQLFRFLRTAGNAGVKNIIYVDMSGELTKTLQDLRYSEQKYMINIIKGVENNYIFTCDSGSIHRLRFNFQHEDLIVPDMSVKLKDLLNEEQIVNARKSRR